MLGILYVLVLRRCRRAQEYSHSYLPSIQVFGRTPRDSGSIGRLRIGRPFFDLATAESLIHSLQLRQFACRDYKSRLLTYILNQENQCLERL